MEIQHTTRRDASQAELLLPAPALPFAGITVVTAWRCSRWGKRKFWHQQVPALRKQTKIKVSNNQASFLSLVLSFCTQIPFVFPFVIRKSSCRTTCMPHVCLMPPPPPRVWEMLVRDVPGVPSTDSCSVSKMLYHTVPTNQKSACEHA